MTRPTVLVAEDEFIIGVDLCDTVEEAGFSVEGPYDTVGSAMDSLRSHRPDLAILDIRLEDSDVYPLAEALMEEDVPVIFHSGQVSPDEVRARFPNATACTKPCPPNEMIAMVQGALPH